ncbi:MAG TPA: LysE family transporter, partial [Candidatus Saccharimonadia bacterium]|nr:LysE family transporter [Candidatus Saccharimonadia bacterium]
MPFATWLLYLVTDVALALTPGPAVLFVVGTGLRHGFRPALGANLGILTANTIYFAASALGLGVLLAAAEPVFVALQWIGAAYLVWLGVASLRAASRARG